VGQQALFAHSTHKNISSIHSVHIDALHFVLNCIL